MAVASLLTSLSTRDSLGVYVTERKWGEKVITIIFA